MESYVLIILKPEFIIAALIGFILGLLVLEVLEELEKRRK